MLSRTNQQMEANQSVKPEKTGTLHILRLTLDLRGDDGFMLAVIGYWGYRLILTSRDKNEQYT